MFKKNQIPNYITYFRILAVIPIVVLLLLPQNLSFVLYSLKIGEYRPVEFSLTWFIGSIIFIIAAFSDFLDGYLARKYNWVSTIGKFLDPVADKIIINAVMIIFACLSYIPAWILIIFFIRDIVVDAARMILSKQNIVVAANKYGKLKTVFQFIAIIIILFVIRFCFNEINHDYYYGIQNLLIFASALLSVLSGIIYIWPNRKILFDTKIN